MTKIKQAEGFSPGSDWLELIQSINERIDRAAQHIEDLEKIRDNLRLQAQAAGAIPRLPLRAYTVQYVIEYLKQEGKPRSLEDILAAMKAWGVSGNIRQSVQDNLLTKAEWEKQGRPGTAQERLKRFGDLIGLPEWRDEDDLPHL